ncbi:MAG: SEC-C metal-binding domain-containing protein [Verrucomicrobiota bacterium]
MRISYYALNRIAEQKAAELRAQGKPAPKPGRSVLSEARQLSEEQLLQRLRNFGMELDQQRLASLVKSHCSAEEIAKGFLDRWQPRNGQEERESDWCWFALTVLWERWFGEVPNFERLDEAMQKGYEQEEESAQCDVWLAVWADLLKLREKARCRSLAEFDDRFGGTQSIFNWVQDFEMALGNAALAHPRYHEARVRVCEEFLREFEAADQLLTQNMRRALAESIYAHGDKARGDALYRGWLAEDPEWGWGWIGWADLYYFARGSGDKDLARAEAILKEGLALEQVRDREDILERLASLYEEQGRAKEAAELQSRGASIRNTVTRSEKSVKLTTTLNFGSEGLPLEELPKLASQLRSNHEEAHLQAHPPKAKVGRNDSCPCGSGKKFKRCCGR